MTQPTLPALQYNFQSELGTSFGTHLDDNFDTLVESVNEIIQQQALLQRDDGWIRSGSVTADSFDSSALALMAGSAQGDSSLDWRPRGDWVTATLYDVGNIVEQGSPATAYVCAVQHTSGTFATDYAAGKWVVLSAPRTLASADVVSALGYSPVNKAGDTMTGALVAPSGTTVAGMAFSDALVAAQDLVTVDKGIYSSYSSSAGGIIYGFAANVARDSGSDIVIGAQFSGYGTGAGATGEAFGANINTFGFSGFAQSLIGLEIDVCSFTPNNIAAKRGLNIIFFNRAGTNPGEYTYNFPNSNGPYTSAGGGLGFNYYNREAFAIQIDSQQRSSTGEYCGWTRGIFFTEYALDTGYNASNLVVPALGIDFSQLHYYGGADPTTAYRMDAAIALRDLQTIWWNRDPAQPLLTNKVRSYFNPWNNRWMLALESVERFGVDVTTGDIYKNGTLFSPPSLSANNVWTGTNTFNNAVTIGGNLTFTGNARRIQAEFSTGTLGNRTVFQTSVTNGQTEFGVIPNGTATGCGIYLLSHSAMTAGVVGRLGADTSGVQLSSTAVGGATVGPLDLAVGGSVFQRINPAGQVMLGTTTAPASAVGLRVAGAVQCDQPIAFSVHRNGSGWNLADSTTTVIDFTTEEFDTFNAYNTGTEQFIPPAGRYHLMGCARTNGVSVDQGLMVLMVYKNGAQYKSGENVQMSGSSSVGVVVSCLVEANGTDAFDLRIYQQNPTLTTLAMAGTATDCWFQGYKVA